MLPKNDVMSASSTQPPPIAISACRRSRSACKAPIFGRYPYDAGRKSCSYTALSTMATARCSTLSSNVGIPRGRFPPSAFSIYARRTGGAQYVPLLNSSSTRVRFAFRLRSYSSAVTSSIPAAPSLRVRAYATNSMSMSM